MAGSSADENLGLTIGGGHSVSDNVFIYDSYTARIRGADMATQSFYQDIVLRTQEEVDRLVAAFEEAERRGPIDTSRAHEPIEDPDEIREIFLRMKS